ncbi:zinc-dependent alcohol dehydrogenase [Labrys monachus]|uniref:L-iditol 2-dehydrogenase n=1 Tax=Labrys monachus TaxID=217067 RepID=A0ABU0FMY0_9HYPH|nr:zinc-binding dehydrogenase [Labrys monachus]MDQ0395871.1 L-iditol 2-dehydrogenase [Labrys monachus]
MQPNRVKAAVMTGPGRIETQHFPYPDAGEDGMVIKLELCGLCGTDKHTYRGETTQYGGTPAETSTPFPIIPGHEIVGTVADIGKRARTGLEYHGQTLAIGDRVVMCPDILCGRCYYCRNFHGFPLCENIRGYGNHYTSTEAPHLMGGWAEHIYVRPDAFVFKVPDSIDADIAVMTELMAVTYNLDKAKSFYSMDGEGFGSGASIAVQGVGPMGLLHVFKARIMGAGDIVALDRSDYRLAMARKFGADHTINVTGLAPAEVVARVRDLTEGRGADLVLECTGVSEAIPQGIEMGRRGGMYIVAGVFADVGTVTLNPHHIAARQLRLIGLCNHPPTGYVNSLKLLEKHQHAFPLRDFVTHRFSVGDADAAMAQAMKLDETMKVVITP